MEYEIGDKIQYVTGHKGLLHKKQYAEGTVHAIRRYENEKGEEVRPPTYLIDTGNDVGIVEVHSGKFKNTSDSQGLVMKVPVLEKQRQPEQLEVKAEHVKAG
jgi:hypothetical protein